MEEGEKKEARGISSEYAVEPKAEGWGQENYPYPKGTAFIECIEMKCVGCGICQMACSMNLYH